ncbi:MAG TPA: helix-turn-helix domain-containing protein [Thermomicrobiales bacterium]|nr:helix-turn-helix domain-containing protein [Thermomicrobiales bacterium]
MSTQQAAGRRPALGRERILAEARARFTEQGFAAVSMQQIADAAGVNKATLYYHFTDKETLFAAVMAEELERLRAGIAAAMAGEAPLRLRLQDAAEFIFAATRADFGRLAAELRQHLTADHRERLFQAHPPPWELFRPAIAQAAAAGEIRPVDSRQTARCFFAMVMSQVAAAKFSDADAPLRPEDAAAIVGILFDGIAPVAASAAAAAPPASPAVRRANRGANR